MESVLTMTQLNDFLFCPRSLYYSGIFRNNTEQEFYHQAPQTTGLAAHAAIDEGRYSTRSDVLTGTMFFCERYNLLGRIDVFDVSSGVLTERKYAVSAVYDGFKLQLYAQYFALTEAGYTVKELRLYSKKDNKVYSVPLPTAEDVTFFENVLKRMRCWMPDRPFASPNPKKCANCIYAVLCDCSADEEERTNDVFTRFQIQADYRSHDGRKW